VLQKMPGMERVFFLLEQELLKPVYTIYPWMPEPDGVPDRNQFELALFAKTSQTIESSENNVYGAMQSRASTGGNVRYTPKSSANNPHSLDASSYGAKSYELAQLRDRGLESVRVGWISLIFLIVIVGEVALFINVRLLYVAIIHGAAIGLLWVMGITAILFPEVRPRNMRGIPNIPLAASSVAVKDVAGEPVFT